MPRDALIRLRGGTAAEWAAANPVLAAREPALETDTGKEKRGDGTTAWNSLPYRGDPTKTPLPGTGINPLTGMFHVDGYGALGDGTTDDGPAIQACFDAADGYLGSGTYNGSARGGKVWFPILSRSGSTFATYSTKQSLYVEARCVYESANGGVSAGGRVVRIKADPTGTYTNGEYTEKFLIKMGRQPASSTTIGNGSKAAQGYWGHGCHFLRFKLDCNNVAGLAGIHWMNAGETMLIDDVEISNTGITARTVADAVFNGTTTVTSASATFTDDDLRGTVSSTNTAAFPTFTDTAFTDLSYTLGGTTITTVAGNFTGLVGAEVKGGNIDVPWTATITSVGGGGLTAVLSDPVIATGSGKTATFGTPRTTRIAQVVNSTTVILDRPVRTSGSSQNLTVNRPRPGMQAHGFGAIARVGSLRGSNCSGYLLEIVDGQTGGSIDLLSADDCGGALRVRQSARGGNQYSLLVKNIKTENNVVDTSLDGMSKMDPVIMLDYNGMANVVVLAGTSSAGIRGARDLVRIQQNLGFSAGFPSVSLTNWEAGNPYNQQYNNVLNDLNTSTVIPAGSLYTGGGLRFYPSVDYTKDRYHLNGTQFCTGPVVLGTLGSGTSLYGGSGAPAFAAPLGSYYFRNDTPGTAAQRIYLCTTANTATTAAWTPHETVVADAQLPRRVVIDMDSQPNAMTQGTWTVAYYANAIKTTQGYNSSSAQNDEARWDPMLSKGTWRIDVNGIRDPGGAILTWDISYDGGTTFVGTNGTSGTLGTHDSYNASKSAEGYSYTGITVPTSGRAILRARVLTRNASNTTGWFMLLSSVTFVRTA